MGGKKRAARCPGRPLSGWDTRLPLLVAAAFAGLAAALPALAPFALQVFLLLLLAGLAAFAALLAAAILAAALTALLAALLAAAFLLLLAAAGAALLAALLLLLTVAVLAALAARIPVLIVHRENPSTKMPILPARAVQRFMSRPSCGKTLFQRRNIMLIYIKSSAAEWCRRDFVAGIASREQAAGFAARRRGRRPLPSAVPSR